MPPTGRNISAISRRTGGRHVLPARSALGRCEHRFRRHRQLHAAVGLARRATDHADAPWGSIYDLDYLTREHRRAARVSTGTTTRPRRGGADPHADHRWRPWRALGLALQGHRGWWAEAASRADRAACGQRRPTAWVPKSSRSGSPSSAARRSTRARTSRTSSSTRNRRNPRCRDFSNGVRDDLIQLQYLRAMSGYWAGHGQ